MTTRIKQILLAGTIGLTSLLGISSCSEDNKNDPIAEYRARLFQYGDTNSDGVISGPEEKRFDEKFAKDNGLVLFKERFYHLNGKRVLSRELGNLVEAYNPN
jgi:hypothetical protein